MSGKGAESLSVPMQIVILLTLLTLLPAIIMSITPFLRIAIVLHFLRQALGTQTVPSNQVLVGISLFLTMLIVQPVATEMYHKGWEPLQKNSITTAQAFEPARSRSRNSWSGSPAKRTSSFSSISRTRRRPITPPI